MRVDSMKNLEGSKEKIMEHTL